MKPTQEEINAAGEIEFAKAKEAGFVDNIGESAAFKVAWMACANWAISQMQPEWVPDEDYICEWLQKTDKSAECEHTNPHSPFYHTSVLTYATFIKLFLDQHSIKLPQPPTK